MTHKHDLHGITNRPDMNWFGVLFVLLLVVVVILVGLDAVELNSNAWGNSRHTRPPTTTTTKNTTSSLLIYVNSNWGTFV